jgi:hypothetical protein
MEVMLSAIAPKLPKIFSLLNSVNEEFSAVGINQDGRLLGYFFTDSIVRDEDTPDSLRLLMDGYDDVIGDVELGAGSPFEAAVWAGPDAGPIKYGAGAYSNFEMSFAWTVSPDGLMTFTNTYDAARTGLWSGKDGQFFVAEMNYEINTNPYFASDDIGRYGLVSGKCVINLLQVFNTLLSQSGGNPYSAIEIYAGAMPEDQDTLFTDDLGVSPIIFANFSPQFSAISSGETAELRLIEPATGVIPDDAPAGMWARIRGLDGLPAMAMPVYTRGQVEHHLEAGGGLVIAVDAVYPGDYVTLASLQFVQPIGELGKPVTAGFAAPVFSATETDSVANVLVLKRGPAAASVSATTSDATAIAGIHYNAFDGSAEWAEFQAGVETLEIGLVPTEIAELSWSTAPDLLVLFPNSGEGDESFGVDEFGNNQITMAWGSGEPRIASYITPHFVEGSPDRPFQINYKINNRGSRLRFGIGAGDTDHSYALTSVEIRGGAAYPWNGITPADIDYEPSLVRILAKIETVLTVDGPRSAVCVKVGINGGWFTPISGVLKEDADDVGWFVLITETNDTDFFLCVSGETTEEQPNIEVLNWQGGDKPRYFTVHLHDPNPSTLLDGDDVIDTAKVTIFQNRLKEIISAGDGHDCLKWNWDDEPPTIPEGSLEVISDSIDGTWTDNFDISGTYYFEASVEAYIVCVPIGEAADNTGAFVDTEFGECGFFRNDTHDNLIYEKDIPSPVRVSLLIIDGHIKLAMDGQWLDFSNGTLHSDPASVSPLDLGQSGAVTAFQIACQDGANTFYAEENQIYRPVGVDAYPLTHFCLGDGPS